MGVKMEKNKLSMAMDDMNSGIDIDLLNALVGCNDIKDFAIATPTQTINPPEVPDISELLSKLLELQEIYERSLFKSIFNVSYEDFENNNLTATQRFYIEKALEHRAMEKYLDDRITYSPYMPYIMDEVQRSYNNRIVCTFKVDPPIKIDLSSIIV